MSSKPVISTRKKRVFSIIMALIPVSALVLAYMCFAAYRMVPVYLSLKIDSGFTGNVHRADPELGFTSLPNSTGSQLLPLGPDIPTRYDAHGFRVPLDEVESSSKRPLILALGCSYTFGYAVLAEESYPYLVGQSIDGTTRNAGICSYGLPQMVILAQRLVPTYKPDYLLVQYS